MAFREDGEDIWVIKWASSMADLEEESIKISCDCKNDLYSFLIFQLKVFFF